MPQVTPSALKEHLMLPDGAMKLSILVAPAGAGNFTGSSVVALADGVDVALDEEVAGSDPPAGPSYPRVNTKITKPRRTSATTARIPRTMPIIGTGRRSRAAGAACGWAVDCTWYEAPAAG